MTKVLARYEAMIAAKREKARMEKSIRQALVRRPFVKPGNSAYKINQQWQERLRTRPILTGSWIRPSLANGPLPRMKPQPEHITMMIRRRRMAYERHQAKFVELGNTSEDLEFERAFENKLFLEGMSKGLTVQTEFVSNDWGKF